MIPSGAVAPLFRRNMLAAATVVALAILGIRFFQYQILKHDEFQLYAEKNSIRSIRMPAPRGLLLDRNGQFLVTNRPYYGLAVVPAEVRGSLEQLRGLSRYIDLTPEEITARIGAVRGVYEQYQSLLLYDDLSFTQISQIEEHRLEFPGIFFLDRTIRHYPSRARATHVIGYLRSLSAEDMIKYKDRGYRPGEQIGAVGLERYLEDRLRGQDGYRYHLVDNLLRDLGSLPNKPPQPARPGEAVALAIDINLQALAEQLFEDRRGAMLMMDPGTGEILAYVSAPDYVLEPFTGSIPVSLWEQWRNNPDKLLLNRPINGLYPPGSTFKLLAAAVAQAYNLIGQEDTLSCAGRYFFGDRYFRCNVLAGHGAVNMEQAIAQSCNIYFYQLIQRIGFDRWREIVLLFGFGEPTGIEVPQESAGLVPSRPYMDRKYADVGWTAGHMLNLVLGQGDILVTPLQLARMTAAIANRGYLVRPTLLHRPPGAAPEGRLIELPDAVWDNLQAAMYQVVYGFRGTGFRAKVPGGRIYGKTGTAQNPHGDGHSWFTGYIVAPGGERAVLTLLVEQGGLGSRLAASLAATVFDHYLNQYLPRQDQDLAQVP